MLTLSSVIGRRDSHFSLQFVSQDSQQPTVLTCQLSCARTVCPVALSFTWSKRIPQIVALGDDSCYATGFPGSCWTWMDGDAIWTTSTAQKLVTGHSELHLGHMPGLEERVGLLRSPSFQRIKKILWGNLWLLLANSLPRHNSVPHLSTSLRGEVKSVSMENIPSLHIPGAKQGGLFCWA